MKRWKVIIPIFLILLVVLTGCKKKKDDGPLTGKHHVKIEVADYGTIKVELDADAAPLTVTNFIKLAKDKFYNGLTFYYVKDGFVIRGGDPLRDGRGGSDEKIKGEFSANGVDNPISHVRGTISMVRPNADYDSASSMFFIVQEDALQLDGQYAAFGKVTDGMEIVDKICSDTIVEDDDGTVAPENQPVITKIKVVD